MAPPCLIAHLEAVSYTSSVRHHVGNGVLLNGTLEQMGPRTGRVDHNIVTAVCLLFEGENARVGEFLVLVVQQ